MIDAAILIPVYRSQDGKLHIVTILRNPGGVHGGQSAFPGGKRDPEDRRCSIRRCAKFARNSV
jgi:hypothetical protein